MWDPPDGDERRERDIRDVAPALGLGLYVGDAQAGTDGNDGDTCSTRRTCDVLKANCEANGNAYYESTNPDGSISGECIAPCFSC
jgi:hypothetical protein